MSPLVGGRKPEQPWFAGIPPEQAELLRGYLADRFFDLERKLEVIRSNVANGPVHGAIVPFDLQVWGTISVGSHAELLVVPELEVLSIGASVNGSAGDADIDIEVGWRDQVGGAATNLLTQDLNIGGFSSFEPFTGNVTHAVVDQVYTQGATSPTRLQNIHTAPQSLLQVNVTAVNSGTPENLLVQVLAQVYTHPRSA